VSQYPIFGSEIKCPHCQQIILALILTDTYLCPRHGAFEVAANNRDLIHLQSDRQWRLWSEQWYRQHTHPDGIRFEIHEYIDQLYTQGYRATKIIIADRYRTMIKPYLESSGNNPEQLHLYGLNVEFSPPETENSQWGIINFAIEKELGTNKGFSSLRFI
jgi:uncharacterized protein (TIGR02652 family)